MQVVRELLRRGPSEWDLRLADAHRNLEVVGANVLRPLVEELRVKDPSVILVEHLPMRDPVFPTNAPSIFWAIHLDLQPTEDIEQAPNLPFMQRRKVDTWWMSRAAGISAGPYEIGDVYFTNSDHEWQNLERNYEFVQHALRRGLKPSELSLYDQLKFALGLATPVGDFRYGKGYMNFDAKPRNYKYWNILN